MDIEKIMKFGFVLILKVWQDKGIVMSPYLLGRSLMGNNHFKLE